MQFIVTCVLAAYLPLSIPMHIRLGNKRAEATKQADEFDCEQQGM